MAFQKVQTGRSYVKYTESQKGDVLAEGYYMGPIDGRFGIQHVVRAEDGSETVLNSAGSLNYILETRIQKGDCIRVTYSGTKVIETGAMQGKEAHQFEVEVDPTKSLAAKPLTTSFEVVESSEPEVAEAPAPVEKAEKATPAPVAAKTSAEDLLAKFRK